jgi:endonuclease III related protein
VKNRLDSNIVEQQARIYTVCMMLIDRYAPLHWWPAKTPFEVMVGAILTQNTNWNNVEKAIQALEAHIPLDAESVVALDPEQLAQLIRPAGYFNVKSARLRNFCLWYLDRGSYKGLKKLATLELRQQLLSVNGIGPETADDMMNYAFDRPVFVVDTYTKRLFFRLGITQEKIDYEPLRTLVEGAFCHHESPVKCFNELHAAIVMHAKQFCRKSPRCSGCLFDKMCQYE